MTPLSPSELILNPDGSIYHLHLRPGELAGTVFFVGDPDRVAKVSQYFDKIELIRQHREFITHTGNIGNKRLSVISTGIGTDNIDIVLNELDALVNIDFDTRLPKKTHESLNIIRLGTTGGLQADMPLDTLLISEAAIGLDGLMAFYGFEGNAALLDELKNTAPEIFDLCVPYAVDCTLKLPFGSEFESGITLTCPGFYGPQNRKVRLNPKMEGIFEKLARPAFNGLKITNMEMETAGIYALAQVFGHRAVSVNAVMANRVRGEFSSHPEKTVQGMIEKVIELVAQS